MENEQLEQYNTQICQNLGVEFSKIVALFEKSTHNNKIVTSKYLENLKNKSYDKFFNKSDHKG